MSTVRRWLRALFRPDSLDRRLAPHVPTELDVRTGWIGFSRERWPV